mmetsp:Transcript_8625/g.25915  ORF Transcript_8625/g.25915 Transcript_8625/m.25915 type:complete len:206 (-) Transcript_8625:2877-3494(-)
MEEARAGVPHRGMCTRCVRIGDNGELVRAVSAAKDSPTAAPTSHEGPRTHLSLGSTDKKGPSVGKHAGNNSAELCEQRRLPGLLDKSEICPRAQTLAQEKEISACLCLANVQYCAQFHCYRGLGPGRTIPRSSIPVEGHQRHSRVVFSLRSDWRHVCNAGEVSLKDDTAKRPLGKLDICSKSNSVWNGLCSLHQLQLFESLQPVQ